MKPPAMNAKTNWRYVVLLRLSVLAGFLLLALSSTAEATPLTSPAGTSFTSTIKAVSEGSISLHNAVGTISCNSTIEGKVESHSATKASGKVTSLTFGACGEGTAHVHKPGSLDLHVNSSGTGTLTSTGAEVELTMFGVECVYTTSNTDLGTLTDSSLTSGNATVDIESILTRTAGSFFCGSAANLEGSYKVTTPSSLYLDPPLSSPLTSPAGNSYTSTIKAESEGQIVLKGPYADVTCKSAIEGKIESHTATAASGKVSALTFKECNFPVKVLKPGSLSLHVESAKLTSSGAELTIETSVGNCIFSTSSTDIGTLTGTGVTGGNATLDIYGVSIPRTEHSFFCGSTGNLNGSYKITTPSTLYLD